jgi:hypothetical protein
MWGGLDCGLVLPEFGPVAGLPGYRVLGGF